MKPRCGQEDCDCGHTIEKLVKALERSAVVIGIAAAHIAPKYRGANNMYDEGVREVAAAVKEAKS